MTFSLRIRIENAHRNPLLIASESVTDDVVLGLAIAPDDMLLVASVDHRWYEIEPHYLLSDDCLDSSGRHLRANPNFAEGFLKRVNTELAALCDQPETAERVRDYLHLH